MKIVVTGSLGHIGRPLTEELVKKGHSVIVISSNPERKEEIEALGATAAIGSVEDLDFLTTTFMGADAVHTMVPPNISAPDMMEAGSKIGLNYAHAIERAGIKRVVYVSSYGAELEKGAGLITAHRHIENALNNIPGLESITHLRATYIYYNLFRFIDMIKNTGVMVANYGDDDRVVMVAPKDIAAAAAEELEAKIMGKKIRYVASDVHTCNEIAQILGTAIGKPDLKWKTISDAEMLSAYEGYGMPAKIANAMVEMFGAIHSDLLHQDYDLHQPQPQLEKVKLEDFAKDFAVVFNQK